MSTAATRPVERPFFGFHMPNYSYPGVAPEHLFEQVVERAQAAEAAGFGLVTVMDHFYQITGVGPEDEPMLESQAMLAALAARTSRVRLGALVAGVTYRNPAVLAKSVTTIDVISGGRAVLGLGLPGTRPSMSATASTSHRSRNAWTASARR